jgi:hypothetical protein
LVWTGESDLARHLLSPDLLGWALFFVWSVAVAEKGVVLMDSAPDLTSLII